MNRETFGFENLMRALNYMKGTLLVCDRNRNVVYYNDVVCSALNIPEEELSGANLMDLMEKGFINNSASVQAFDTHKLSIKYVQGKMKVPILTVSNPVLDQNGEVEYVVALSVNEELLEVIAQEMLESRLKSMQLLGFYSTKMSDHATVIAESKAMQDILAYLGRASMADSNVLLTGETGVGKEVLAKYIHNSSSRSEGVFIPVNCAAIPESLMESEFFGYAKGAFTGAAKDGKAGLFELADGGTLFLDEIGEMPLLIQAKFLRVIETREVTRLGSEARKQSNFRLVAATNRNLWELCRRGEFRSDLYYRLNILSVEIPPLRERREDIIPLAKFFLNGLNRKYGHSKILSYSAHRQLRRYTWPGNVRELRNVIERMVITASSDILEFDQHNVVTNPVSPCAETNAEQSDIPTAPVLPASSLRRSVEAYEKKLVFDTLNACDGSVPTAAKVLGLHKSVLYRKLEHYRNSEIL